MISVQMGQTAALRYLLGQGADVNKKSNDNQTIPKAQGHRVRVAGHSPK